MLSKSSSSSTPITGCIKSSSQQQPLPGRWTACNLIQLLHFALLLTVAHNLRRRIRLLASSGAIGKKRKHSTQRHLPCVTSTLQATCQTQEPQKEMAQDDRRKLGCFFDNPASIHPTCGLRKIKEIMFFKQIKNTGNTDTFCSRRRRKLSKLK